jgi:hypothetical protein
MEAGMDYERFNDIANRWGWSRRYLAVRFVTGSTTVDNWATGRVSIPAAVAAWMEAMDAVFIALPAPNREQWHRLLGQPKEVVQLHYPAGQSTPQPEALAA